MRNVQLGLGEADQNYLLIIPGFIIQQLEIWRF